MDRPTNERGWYAGQRVCMQIPESLVPPGTHGTVMRVYPELNTLIVRFDGEHDVCLVGGEELVAVLQEPVERERAVGESYV